MDDVTTQKRVITVAIGILALAAVFAIGLYSVARTAAPPLGAGNDSTPAPPAGGGAVRASAPECTEPTVTVATAAQLQAALDAARPGDVISLADATFFGHFEATVSGTAEQPISLCGTSASILDGGGTRKGYVLHLNGVSHWNIDGFAVRNGQKGVMADTVTNSAITGLTVSEIGDEGIHLRRFSTDNVVSGNTVSDTGLRKEKFGEGIYIGTAESNWCDITDCEPDRSDRNVIESNIIERTTSESVDIKEGTSGGILRGNTFNGELITAADSWVDVKGNDWLVEANVGVSAPQDGFQTHEILDGWGTNNVFRSNSATVNADGFGFSLTPVRDNVVECSNVATAAGEGFSNVDCSAA